MLKATIWLLILFGSFICEEIRGCVNLRINEKVSILKSNTTYTDGVVSTNGYIKRLFDSNDFFETIKKNLPSDESVKVKSKENLRIFFPSAVWIPEKQRFLVTARVFLLDWTSFVYVTFFDSEWNELHVVEYVGLTPVPGLLPITCTDRYNRYSGPEDARLFRALNGNFFLIFNMHIGNRERSMFLYNFENRETTRLWIKEHRENPGFLVEKNWIPIIYDQKRLTIVYNFRGFQIIDCTDTENCIKVNGDYNDNPAVIRGGSPFSRFQGTNYYISLGFTHIANSDDHHAKDVCVLYRPALVIVKIVPKEKTYKIIYTSDPLDFNKRIFLYPVTFQQQFYKENLCRHNRILIGISIAKIDYTNDVSDLTLFYQDEVSLVVKIKGLANFVSKTIQLYEKGELPLDDDCAEWYAIWNNEFKFHSPRRGVPSDYAG